MADSDELSQCESWPIGKVMHTLTWILSRCYIVNGATVRRQIKGIPMGIAPSPQLANLFCYVTERDFAEQTKLRTMTNARFLDDLFAPDPIPSEEQYGMKYAATGEWASVNYIGMRVYEQDGKVRTPIYDREEEYPFHTRRYPAKGSVVSAAQWKGRFQAVGILGTAASGRKRVYRPGDPVDLETLPVSEVADLRGESPGA